MRTGEQLRVPVNLTLSNKLDSEYRAGLALEPVV